MARACKLALTTRLGSGLALAVALAASGGPLAAQGVPQRPNIPGGVLRSAPGAAGALPVVSQPVVQQVPGKEGRALDAALGRLARDPRDIDALIEAGNAALVMGDIDAATGFFRRADQVAPGNPRVKAGLAGAMVHNGDPFGAIPLFDEAEKAGVLDGALAADRGLAYDLVGDNATAQRFYRQALTRGPSDEAVRRLALSLAIAGDKHGAEQVLSPLLSQRNPSAWRTRAFTLAIGGQVEEAVTIANTVLPSELAGAVAPYLRYMPRLTRAQQAAAANFGAFPRASEIGRDDPRVAQFAPPTPSKRGILAAVDAALKPQGEPLGRKTRERDRRANRGKSVDPARDAPPDLQPAREVAAAAPVRAAPQVAVAPPRRTPTSTPTPTPAPKPTAAPLSTPAPSPAVARPVAPATPPPVPTPAPSPPPAVAPPAAAPAATPPAAREPAPLPRSLAEAFAEFDRPSTDATPAAGAVDLRRIKPTRPKPAEPPKPLPPSHPSRIWVQVATGRDKAALGFDWRRLTREKAEVFRGKLAFVSAWGQTNRLLTGPFQTEAAANSYIAQLRRADVDGAFVWTSPAGQVVDGLAVAATPRR